MTERLRELEIASKDDPMARYRYRVECVRRGEPERAGFEVGDLVAVGLAPGISCFACGTLAGAKKTALYMITGLGRTSVVEPALPAHDYRVQCVDESHHHAVKPMEFSPWADRSFTLLEPARPA